MSSKSVQQFKQGA